MSAELHTKKTEQRWIIIYFSFAILDGIVAVIYLLLIPPDPKNSVFLGFSSRRLLLVSCILVPTMLLIYLLLKTNKNPGFAYKLSDCMIKLPVFTFTYFLFTVSTIAFISSFLIFPKSNAAYIERVRPLILWLLLLFGQTLLFQVLFGKEEIRYQQKQNR